MISFPNSTVGGRTIIFTAKYFNPYFPNDDDDKNNDNICFPSLNLGPGEPRARVRHLRVRAEERPIGGILKVQGAQEGGATVAGKLTKY